MVSADLLRAVVRRGVADRVVVLVAATLLLEAIHGREFTEPYMTADPVFTPRESTAAATR